MGEKPTRAQLGKIPQGHQIDASRIVDAPAARKDRTPVQRPSSDARALSNVRRVNGPPPVRRKDPAWEAVRPVAIGFGVFAALMLPIVVARLIWIHRRGIVTAFACVAIAIVTLLVMWVALGGRRSKSGGCPPPCKGC